MFCSDEETWTGSVCEEMGSCVWGRENGGEEMETCGAGKESGGGEKGSFCGQLDFGI